MTRRRQSFRAPETPPRPEPPCIPCYVAAAGLVSAVLGVSLLAVWSAWWVRP